MPVHDFQFDVYRSGSFRCINIASGYDPEINLCINHYPKWWIVLLREESGDYTLNVQIGNNNTIRLGVDRDGCRGVDEDRLEVTAKGRYRIDLLARALFLVKERETRIVYAMEWLYQASQTT